MLDCASSWITINPRYGEGVGWERRKKKEWVSARVSAPAAAVAGLFILLTKLCNLRRRTRVNTQRSTTTSAGAGTLPLYPFARSHYVKWKGLITSMYIRRAL